MKTIQRLIGIAICLFVLTPNASAQNDKMFHSLGFAAFTTSMRTPAAAYDYNEYDSSYYYGSTRGIGFISIEYTFRYTLWEANDAFSIGANASPLLSSLLTVPDGGYEEGFGALFSLPIYVTANFGEGSTYNGSGNKGGFVGIGYELNTLLGLGENYNIDPATNAPFEAKNSWGQIKIATGFRWWSKRDQLKELSFKYGFGKQNKDIPENAKTSNTSIKNPMSWSLTYNWFLNY